VQESNLQPSVSRALLFGVQACVVAFHKWLTTLGDKLRSTTVWQFAPIPAKIRLIFGCNWDHLTIEQINHPAYA